MAGEQSKPMVPGAELAAWLLPDHQAMGIGPANVLHLAGIEAVEVEAENDEEPIIGPDWDLYHQELAAGLIESRPKPEPSSIFIDTDSPGYQRVAETLGGVDAVAQSEQGGDGGIGYSEGGDESPLPKRFA